MNKEPYAVIHPDNQFPVIANLVDFARTLGIKTSVRKTGMNEYIYREKGLVEVTFNTGDESRELCEEERTLIYRVLENFSRDFILYSKDKR